VQREGNNELGCVDFACKSFCKIRLTTFCLVLVDPQSCKFFMNVPCFHTDLFVYRLSIP
jgi:hypothetical protein